MVRDTPIPRRTLLRAVEVGILGAIAGCTSTGGDGQQSGGDDQTTTVAKDHAEDRDHDEHGADHGHGHTGGLESPTHHAEVEMVTEDGEHHFEPHAVWVEEGGEVTWSLTSGSHSTTAYHENNDSPKRIPDGAEAWDSGILSEEGVTFKQAFETSRVYDYFCEPHKNLGMVATVLVGELDLGGQPGLEPPQESLPEAARTAIEALNEQVSDALEK